MLALKSVNVAGACYMRILIKADVITTGRVHLNLKPSAEMVRKRQRTHLLLDQCNGPASLEASWWCCQKRISQHLCLLLSYF